MLREQRMTRKDSYKCEGREIDPRFISYPNIIDQRVALGDLNSFKLNVQQLPQVPLMP